MGLTTTIFGSVTTDTPRPATVMGMPGWWTVPRHWYSRPYKVTSSDGTIDASGTNQWEVCEKVDFSGKIYMAVIGDDGITMVFQDLLRNRTALNDI